MMKKGLITLAICCFTILLMGQDMLTIQTHTKQKVDTLELKLEFNVAPGMHVYAPSSLNLSQGYSIMKLEINSSPEGLKLLPDHLWPATTFAGGGEVYIGEGHTITCRFAGKAKQTPAIIKGVLHYQACNEEMCFPPQEIAFTITLQKQSSPKSKKQQL